MFRAVLAIALLPRRELRTRTRRQLLGASQPRPAYMTPSMRIESPFLSVRYRYGTSSWSYRLRIRPVPASWPAAPLVISDAHEGTKTAVAKMLHATQQRCRVHFMRNVLAHAGRQGRRVVAAFIGTAFVQDDAEPASKQWRQVADQLRPKVPKLAALMDEPEADFASAGYIGVAGNAWPSSLGRHSSWKVGQFRQDLRLFD